MNEYTKAMETVKVYEAMLSKIHLFYFKMGTSLGHLITDYKVPFEVICQITNNQIGYWTL